MRKPKDMLKGCIHNTKTSGNIEIINYINSKNIQVRFLNTGFTRTSDARHIRDGVVKDPTARNIFGVACFGSGKYKKGSNKEAYKKWYMMLYRCYDPLQLNRRPSYQNVFVCDAWLNFQNFAAWFELNNTKGKHLDKDILIDGNKIYSPETCLFVTQTENQEKASAKKFIFYSPLGRTVKIYNMHKFCRENGLNRSAMANVACGISKTHKGWRRAD